MRTLLPALLLSSALLLSGCGAGPTVNDAANQAATAAADPTAQAALDEAANAAATELANPTTQADIEAAANEAATALAGPTAQAAISEAATAVTGPEAASAVAEAAGALSAVADDVTLQQGQALILDATQSVGSIQSYSWTIADAPQGAESVEGQVIREASNGNITLEPSEYEQYFPTAGPYTIRLTVTDASGNTSIDDFTINVP